MMEAGPVDADDAYWQRYGEPIDLDNDNDSRAVVLGLVGTSEQRILELGCSAGYMTKVMHERGHHVTAVEIDPVAAELAAPYADRLLVGDLDHVGDNGEHLFDDLADVDRREGASFDVLIAADVLEHLRNPAECLRRALALVADDGSVILSIPNVAHGDVRLALLAGHFDYADHGLLDRTHVQLFTLDSLVALITGAGLAPVRWERSVRAMGETEVEIDENLLEFGRRVLADDPEAETYQWIVTCRRAAVVGNDAVWPQTPVRNAAVDGIVEVVNQPVAHPSNNSSSYPTTHPATNSATHPATGVARRVATTAIELVPATIVSGTSRRLRRVAAIGRGRLASLLSR